MTHRYVGALVMALVVGLFYTPEARAQSAVRDLDAGQFRAHLPLAGEFDVTKGVGDFLVKGDRLYVAAFNPPSAVDPNGAWRIFIYDVRDRSNPVKVATAPIKSEPGARFRLNTVEVRGDYLYTAGDNDDLFVVDIENLQLPVVFVRSDALVNDLEDVFDFDFFGFTFSEVKKVKYRKIIIEDDNMYVWFDFTVDTDALFVPDATSSSVAVIHNVDDFPFRIAGKQTGTNARTGLLNNIADTGDEIKSFDYENGHLFLGFKEVLDVLPVGDAGKNIELDKGSCGGIFNCLRDLFRGGDKVPYRDLVADGNKVYIVFEDGLLVKRVKDIHGGERIEQNKILQIEPTLRFAGSDGFARVLIDDDKVYLADLNGNILALDDADTSTPGVVGAVVNAGASNKGHVTRMEEDFGDVFLSTSDNGVFIISAFDFEGGSSSGGGGCVARPVPGMDRVALALALAPLATVVGWRRWRRGRG
jgi:hypothetical protein